MNFATILKKRFRKISENAERMSNRRLLSALLIVTALVAVPLLSVWQVAHAAGEEVRPLKIQQELDEAVVTKIFSARRVPQTLVEAISAGKVQSKLFQVSAAMPADSCLMINTEGKNVFAKNTSAALIPGSNQKLLVAAVALDVLGPDRRFTTNLLGIVDGSTVKGDLWLVGSGDPLLTTRAYPVTEKYPTITPTDIENLVDAMVALGITKVDGGVIGDESIYDRERYVPSWGDGIRSVEAGPLGALMINDGVLTGTPLKPVNPAYGAASEFTKLLQARGITVRDFPDVGTASIDTPVIASLQSVTMREVVTEMLTNSDNNTAELLVKEIGLAGKNSATRKDGLTVIAEKIAEWGLPGEGVALIDGSGLDRDNRLTCNLLVQLLQRDGRAGLVTNSMAIAGKTGTLRDTFLTGPGTGEMLAKTGTLNGVKSLSGMFPLNDDRSSVFSLIMNGPGSSTLNFYRPIWNNLATALAFGNDRIDIRKVQPLSQSAAP